MDSIKRKIILNYWTDKLKKAVFVEKDQVISSTQTISINRSSLSYFYKLTSGNEIAEFTLLLTIYGILIQRYFQNGNFISSPGITLRSKQLLFYSIPLSSDETIREFLLKIKQEVEEVAQHLNDEYPIARSFSEGMDVPFHLSYKENFSNFGSNFILKVDNSKTEGLKLSIHYSKNFTNRRKAEHLLKNMGQWIKDLEKNINRNPNSIELVTETEKHRILYEFNNTSQVLEDKEGILIHQLIEEQALNNPNNIAIVYEDLELTYEDVNERSNKLADYLVFNYKINPSDFVGVKVSRNEKLVIAMLAVLKTGAAYVPMDLNYPEERITYIQKDSSCKLIIDDQILRNFEKEQANYSKENQNTIKKPNDLAYIIYTSGTTGKPKGVMVSHRNAVALINWAQTEFSTDTFDTVYAVTSHCFDLSVYEIFYSLSVGKRIRILSSALGIGESLKKDAKVLINTVPSTIRNLIESKYDLSNITAINLAGESFPVDMVGKLLSTKAVIRNLYGPSEDTTYSTCYKLSSSKKYDVIPIGKPIANTKAYILDDTLQVQPIGVVGKLFLSGHGISKGYLNRKKLTADKFIESPFRKGDKIYDTGDFAKWLPDGNIIFIGRKDHQIKFRGYRIELGEIEHNIQSFSDNILQSVVAVKKDKAGDVLVGYYTESDIVEKESLLIYLESRLPTYMVPSHLMQINAIPLTFNGKVNRDALPEVEEFLGAKRKYTPPLDPLEKKLTVIWEQVLGTSPIGRDDHFFELGGHSLMIGQIINSIYKDLQKSVSYKLFYTNPTIKDLKKALKIQEYIPISKAQKAEDYPITASQYRFWLLSHLEGGNEAYQISGAVELKGEINELDFIKAFDQVVEDHEILRTIFKKNKEKEVRQYILSKDELNFFVESEDYSNKRSPEDAVQKYIKEKHKQIYNLSHAPLLKASLIRTSVDVHVFYLSMHHMIGDGWSLDVLTNQVLKYYAAFQTGESIIPHKNRIQFKDYAVWLRREKENPRFQIAKKYWLKQFDDVPVLQLPTNKSRPLIKTFNGGQLYDSFSKELLLRIKKFSAERNVTLFTVLIAGIRILLSKYSNQDDIVIGTPVAGRQHPDLEDAIGLFINTLAIRNTINKQEGFSELLQREGKRLIEAYEFQNYPFDALIDELKITRDSSRSPLFDVMVVYNNQRDVVSRKNSFSNIKISPYKTVQRNVSQFDLTFSFIENEYGLNLELKYNSDVYDQSMVEQVMVHYKNLLEASLDYPDTPIQNVNYLSEVEVEELIYGLNDTKLDYPSNETIIDLFVKQVQMTPEAVAIVYEDRTLTYRELNEKTNQLARYLQDIFGDSEILVPICIDCPMDMIIGMLGVIKSGGAFVPVDSNYPQHQIDFILRDTGSKLLLTHSDLSEMFTGRGEDLKLIYLNELIEKLESFSQSELEIKISSNQLVYVIYTSGTTGTPKGVMVEHINLIDYLHGLCAELKIDTPYSYGLMSTLSADLGHTVLFGSLVTGGELHTFSRETLTNASDILSYFQRHKIDIIKIVPSHWLSLCNNEEILLPQKAIIFGGERLTTEIVNKVKFSKPLLNVFNHYGPTETTVGKLMHRVDFNQKYNQIPLGKVFSKSKVYILNEDQGIVPKGMVGEIYVGGAGVARGYLNRPQLTAGNFIFHPKLCGERLYKTGDLGRWLQNGNIEFLGRKDDQVKVRGYRIELGGIESVLLLQEVIAHAVVVVQDYKNNKIIVAYVVLKTGGLDKKQLREELSKELPEYMLPNCFVELEKIPLTSNGKVDKRLLPKVGDTDFIKEEHVAPRTKREKLLVEIWQDVLGIDRVGITDNFFELGGHSLKAVRLINEIEKLGYKLKLTEVFEFPTIERMEKRFRKFSEENITKAPEQEYYPLTSSQRRIWTLSQFEGGSVAYNMVNVLKIEGILDTTLLQESIDFLVARHESLRTIFKLGTSGTVGQCVIPKETARCIMDEYIALKEEEILSIIDHHLNHKFDLTRLPLLKIGVINIDEENHLLLFNLHHIVGDGWSMEILSQEIITQYNRLRNGTKSELSRLPIQFKDYAHWMESALQKGKLEKSKRFWHKHLEENLSVLELPSKMTRPKVKTYNGAEVTHSFSNEFLTKLRAFCQKNGATLFMGLMAGLNGLLYRYSGQTDIILGTPVAGREHSSLENQIGLYLNTLAIRTRFEAKDTYKSLIDKQKRILMQAYEHQNYPFDSLIEELSIKRDTSRSPLFDILVVLQNQQDVFPKKETISGLKISQYKNFERRKSHFDISFSFNESVNGLNAIVEYNTDIYDLAFIQKILNNFGSFINQGIKIPEQSISKIDFTTFEEKERLLKTFNATQLNNPQDKTVVDLIVKQTKETPNHTAVVYEDKKMTYKELDEQSNALAHYLLSKYEIQVGDTVGVKLERSEWLIVSILAILKLGAAYVPIDPGYPEDRISYIEEDSSCKVIIKENLLRSFEATEKLSVALPETIIKQNSLAYIIYTSGSTGLPKGVMIEHQSAVNFLNWSNIEFDSTDFDIVYASTSHCFDLSVFEMFYPLSVGKKIRVISNGLSIADYIYKDRKILINSVPTVVSNLLERGVSLRNVSAINMAGESIPISLSNSLCEYPIELRNLYGPSESTTYSSCYKIDRKHDRSIPIGRPISNTQFYIFSEELILQPEGVVGELCISGDGLSRGYLNRENLTKEMFISHPFKTGERLYRTGDLAKWLPDGNVEFIGRKDDQVKIRGYRIELEEIAYALKQEKGIINAVALIKEKEEERYIVSYLQCESGEVDFKELRNNLLSKLPRYMIPSHFNLLEKIPLTSNGKIDKKKLLQLNDSRIKTSDYVAPTTEIERQLVALWQDILEIEKVGITDDFFELGGHSLKATKLLAVIQEQFNVYISIQELFVHSTIENLVMNIENAKWLEEAKSKEPHKKIII